MVFLVDLFFFLFFYKPIGFMYAWQTSPQVWCGVSALRFLVGVCHTMMVGGLVVTIYQ